MSWWNASSFSDLASQAIKNAQKKIDKVLEIDEEGLKETKPSTINKPTKEETSKQETKDDFWNTWVPSPQSEGAEGATEKEGARSSWSTMPWGSVHQDLEPKKKTSPTLPTSPESKGMKQKALDPISTTVQQSGVSKKAGHSAKSEGKSSKRSTDKVTKNSSDNDRKAVGNIPVVESKEKVENWDSSSAWSSEPLIAWQGEGQESGADLDLEGSQHASFQGKGQELRPDSNYKKPNKENEESLTDLCPGNKELKMLEKEDSKGDKTKELLPEDSDQTISSKTLDKDLSDSLLDDKSTDCKTDKSSSISVIESVEGVISFSDDSDGKCDQSSSVSLLQTDSGEMFPCHSEGIEDHTIDLDSVVIQTSETQDSGMASSVMDHEVKESPNPADTGSELVICENIDTEKHASEGKDSETQDDKEEALSESTSDPGSVMTKIDLKETSVDADNVLAQSSISSGSGEGTMEEIIKDPGVTEIDVLESLGSVHSPSTCSSLCSSDTSKLDSSMDTHTSEDTVVDNRGEDERVGEISQEEEISAGEVTPEEASYKEVTQNTMSGSVQVSQQETGGQDLAEIQDDSHKITDSMFSVSSSSSYVKCMIEEAMEDNSRSEDNNSDCHSTGGEKSECSRSTGGQESGDDIDTTTSSDIEIISTPNSINNGEPNKMVDLSPLKIALQKTARRESPTHRRTDSASSSSTHSREGQGEQLSPGRDSLEDESQYELAPVREEKGDPYMIPQKVLKKRRLMRGCTLQTVPEHTEVRLTRDSYCDSTSTSMASESTTTNNTPTPPISPQTGISAGGQKMAEMEEVILARESKLVQLSKENNDLLETNSILRNQIQQLEETRELELEDVSKVSTEFAGRIAESEKKLNSVIRERDTARKDLQKSFDDFAKKVRGFQSEIEEKDQQIAELLQEGEKLSKQQLQSNNIVKKLRVKEKENDSLLTSQKKQIDDQQKELDHLRTVCESKDVMEKKQTDGITQLNSAVQKQEREISKLKGELTDAQERVRGLQAALDNSYKEIAELHKSKAAQDSKVQETALSLEMSVREELKATLTKEQFSFKQEREALIAQIEDLRMSMSRMEKEHNRREDMLRQEISDLQMHLQEDEARNQDLTHSVTSATRPLLRQIENLQSTYAAQSTSWEKLEKTLTDRIVDTQSQLAIAVEKERSANENVIDLTSNVTALESQNCRLRQEKSQHIAQLEMLKTRVEVLEDAKNSETAQIEIVKHQMSQELSEVKKEKMFLETQLDMERTKLDQEKKKMAIAQDQIAQLEREIQRPHSRGSMSPQNLQRMDSMSSFGEPSALNTSFTQDDLERNFLLSPGSSGLGSLTKSSLYENIRHSGAANLLENLQSQLKLREGEITQLQSEIQQLERTRESMARELVNLTNQNEDLKSQVESLPVIKNQMQDLNQRYNAMLQMYGEKVEEAEELKMDLHDVKEMYKTQIDHLLTK
ncbi:TATA element modulatory factor-like isoform X4 [Mizuhopecten yessoensis]|uniref:TATA element modulatory factor-like isoform X4 n=1 Tax=Mizuhopecten yessoensis TaxID=6573 RepID=UPI000B457BD5|nr:TATA element modulatory factor-like isoform X4 [Mizuhopecten yessoensis]